LIYTYYAGPAGMLLCIIGGLTIKSVVSENKIGTWKVYGCGRRADNSEGCHV
jgi:hypothetical protein